MATRQVGYCSEETGRPLHTQPFPLFGHQLEDSANIYSPNGQQPVNSGCFGQKLEDSASSLSLIGQNPEDLFSSLTPTPIGQQSEYLFSLIGQQHEDAHRTLSPMGLLPEDSQCSLALIGQQSEDSKSSLTPIGQQPEDSQSPLAPIGQQPEDTKCSFSPIGQQPEDSQSPLAPIGQQPEDTKSSFSPIGQQPEDSKSSFSQIGQQPEDSYSVVSSNYQQHQDSQDSLNLPLAKLTEDNNVQRRLRTYTHWNGKISALLLAAAGFIYTGIGDKVQCFSCEIRLYNRQISDDPLHTHKKYAPNCGFLLKNFPHVKAPRKPHKPLSIKYPHYSSYQSRLDSFEDWPLDCVAQKPEMMARSGFFYFGSADRARCFHCGVTLRDWDTDDYPPRSHKQWSEHCPFVQTLDVASMTEEIEEWKRIEQIRKELENSTFLDCSSSLRASNTDRKAEDDVTSRADNSQLQPSKADNSQSLSSKRDTCRQVSPLTSKSPAFVALVDMGYPRKDIYRAAEVKRSEGCLNPDATTLLSVILDLK